MKNEKAKIRIILKFYLSTISISHNFVFTLLFFIYSYFIGTLRWWACAAQMCYLDRKEINGRYLK